MARHVYQNTYSHAYICKHYKFAYTDNKPVYDAEVCICRLAYEVFKYRLACEVYIMLHRLAHVVYICGLACPHVQVCSLISGAIAICLHMRSVCPRASRDKWLKWVVVSLSLFCSNIRAVGGV